MKQIFNIGLLFLVLVAVILISKYILIMDVNENKINTLQPVLQTPTPIPTAILTPKPIPKLIGSGPTFDQDDQALVEAFKLIEGNSRFPVIGRSLVNVKSAFGPRIKVSEGYRYDWHKGIDVGENKNEQVINAYDGEFEGIFEYPDGGITVVVRHVFPQPLLFKEKSLSNFYTLYMHLDKVEDNLVSANTNRQHPKLLTGDKIGLMGSTGTTEKNHLHFEVRVGTRCSLDYQIANPQSSCSVGYGFDPHVNPLYLFKPVTNNFYLTKYLRSNNDFQVTYSSNRGALYLDRIEYQVFDGETGKKIKSHVLDFNTRTGFDATSVKALDIPDKSVPYIEPVIFNTTIDRFETNIIIPKSFWEANAPSISVMHVTDMWGNTENIRWWN